MGRGRIAGVALALLLVSALSGAPANFAADGAQRRGDCSVTARTDVCESQDKTAKAKDKAREKARARDKGRVKDRVRVSDKVKVKARGRAKARVSDKAKDKEKVKARAKAREKAKVKAMRKGGAVDEAASRPACPVHSRCEANPRSWMSSSRRNRCP